MNKKQWLAESYGKQKKKIFFLFCVNIYNMFLCTCIYVQGLGFDVVVFGVFCSSVELNKEKTGMIRHFLKFVWEFSFKITEFNTGCYFYYK